jgi:predicted DNA-binding transcriptional regulator AlpA
MPRGIIDPARTDPPETDEPILSKRDICSRFCLTLGQLSRAIVSGDFPAPDLTLTPRVLRWKPSTVEAWIAQRGSSRKERPRAATA